MLKKSIHFAKPAWNLWLSGESKKLWRQLTHQNFHKGWMSSYWHFPDLKVPNLSFHSFEKTLNELHVSTKLSTSSTWSKSPNHLITSLSSMQLAIFYHYVFLLPGGSAAVPLNRLGQEDGFGKRPLATAETLLCCWCPQNDCTWKILIRRKQLPVDGPRGDGTSLYVWWVAIESSQLGDKFCHFSPRS